MNIKNTLLSLIAGAAMMLGVSAKAQAQDASEAVNVVKQSVSLVLADLKQNKSLYEKDPVALRTLINTKVLPYFDERSMAVKVLGPSWKAATKQQQNNFINQFKQLVLRTYSSNLLDYAYATVTYGKAELAARGRIALVDADVKNADGKEYPLTLTLINKKGQWKIIDVSMDGLSLITIYSSAIADEINSKGLQGIIDEYTELNRRGETLKN